MDIVRDFAGWRARIATSDDNARLCEILRDVDMQADLHVTEERDPDFFAIHALHLGEAYTLLIEDKQLPATHRQNIVGFCSAIVRDGFIDGDLRRVAYVCDLRLVSHYRNKRILPKACKEFFDFLHREKQVEAFYSVSLQSNVGAVAARRFSGGHVMCEFSMVNLPLVGRRRATPLTVSKASETDIDALAAFLATQARSRTFGYCLDRDHFKRRLQTWPGLQLNDFYLVRNAAGHIIGCTAPWSTEPHHLRQTRVLAYNGKMRWIRRLYNLEAMLRGFRCLPDPGQTLQQISLTHLEVLDDDPMVFRSLLQAVFNDYRGRDIHFINVMIPDGSAMASALQGFRSQSIRFDVNCFLPPGSLFHGRKFVTLRPGFEMAIH